MNGLIFDLVCLTNMHLIFRTTSSMLVLMVKYNQPNVFTNCKVIYSSWNKINVSLFTHFFTFHRRNNQKFGHLNKNCFLNTLFLLTVPLLKVKLFTNVKEISMLKGHMFQLAKYVNSFHCWLIFNFCKFWGLFD